MKSYIGNKIICLAQPEDRDDIEGYEVLYPDGSETWLTKEIFQFEFREFEDVELDMILTTLDVERIDGVTRDWEELTEDDQEILQLDMDENPSDYTIVEPDEVIE